MQRIPCKTGEPDGYVEFEGLIIIPGNMNFIGTANMSISPIAAELEPSMMRFSDIADDLKSEISIVIIQPRSSQAEHIQLVKWEASSTLLNVKRSEIFYLTCNNGHSHPYTIEI